MPFEKQYKPKTDPSERKVGINFVSPEELKTKSPEVTPLLESKRVSENDQVLAITSISQVKEVVAQLSQGGTHYIREGGYGTTETHAGTKIPDGYELYFNRFPQSPNQKNAWYPVKELGTTRDGSKVVVNYGSVDKTPISDRNVGLVLVKKADQSETEVSVATPPTSTRKTTTVGANSKISAQGVPKKTSSREKETPSSEAREVRDITEWGTEVKRLFESGEAQAFVNARTNFDITEKDGRQVVVSRIGHREGYGYTMLRGGLTEKQAEAAYLMVTELVQRRNKNYPSRLDKNTLYITSIDHNQIEQLPGGRSKQLKEGLGGITEGKTVLAFDYLQEKTDMSNRSGGKSVYLIVPNEVASKFNALVEAGTEPGDIHQSLVSIFTTPETQEYFDASLLNTHGATPEVTKRPEKPKFEKIVQVN